MINVLSSPIDFLNIFLASFSILLLKNDHALHNIPKDTCLEHI